MPVTQWDTQNVECQVQLTAFYDCLMQLLFELQPPAYQTGHVSPASKGNTLSYWCPLEGKLL
jgi:hypothetical protein